MTDLFGIILKMFVKSCCCMGSIFIRQAHLSSVVELRIICRNRSKRLFSKNMCSVRTNPTPSAP